MNKNTFRTEVLAELRELSAVGRRLAAVAEQWQVAREITPEKPVMEPVGFIHTRGPNEGYPIAEDDWDEPRWIECHHQAISIEGVYRMKRFPNGTVVHEKEPWITISDPARNVYDQVVTYPEIQPESSFPAGAIKYTAKDGTKSFRLRVKRVPKVGTWTPVANGDEPAKTVHCDVCGRSVDFPNADYRWTSDGISHTFCYENQHLYTGDIEYVSPNGQSK